MTQPTIHSGTSVDTAPDVLPAERVESLLGTLAKTLRAYQMYQANNPVYKRFHEALEAEFTALWDSTDALELTVGEDGFGYGGRVFSLGQGRDSLAFGFYKDGIRYLKFLPGFESELHDFLDAVRRGRRRDDDADDMLSVLWEADIGSLQYGYIDLLTEGVAVPDSPLEEPEPIGESPFVLEGLELVEEEDGERTDGSAPQAGSLAAGLTRDDFDETLYFLDPSEMAAVHRELEVEMERDLHRDVLNALFDRLDDGGRRERQEEIMGILDQLLPLFLSQGDMGSAATVLDELDRLAEADWVDAALAERIDRLFRRLGDPEVLEQFVQALEDGAVSPESEEVTLFFSRLHAEALPILLRYSKMSENPEVRERLQSAINGLAARYPAEVSSLLASSEPALVQGAARAAGRVGLAQAVPGLDAALSHPDRDVRIAVVGALVAIRNTPALQALTRALTDDDRDVRIAAANALGEVRFASARDALDAALADRRLKIADLTEQMAFYEAYGAVGGNVAVERLDKVLNDKGFLGRRPSSEVRACAALGLGKVGTQAAREALERAQSQDDPIVRNAVYRALKGQGAAE